MKKIIFAALAVIALASCSRTGDAPPVPATESIEVSVGFSVGGHGGDTRAFFDDDAAAEPWEKELKTANLYLYGPNGDLALHRFLTAAEIAAGKAVLALPVTLIDKECRIVLLANESKTDIPTYAKARSYVDNTWGRYLSSHAEDVIGGCVWPGGFLMVGETAFTVGNDSATNITLRRNVAKVAFRVSVSDDFSARHNGGTVTIVETGIFNVNGDVYLLEEGVYPPDLKQTIIQKPLATDLGFDNLFYLAENPADGPVRVLIVGYFDADGDQSTTHDRVDLAFNCYLEFDGNGKINRNRYYRIKGTITDLDEIKLETTFTVAEWETPATEELDDLKGIRD